MRPRPRQSVTSKCLGYHGLTDPDRAALTEFFAAARLLPLDQPVLDQAVALRQQKRMSLGDSLVAATALVHGLTLVTKNVSDFQWIRGLKYLDPLSSPP